MWAPKQTAATPEEKAHFEKELDTAQKREITVRGTIQKWKASNSPEAADNLRKAEKELEQVLNEKDSAAEMLNSFSEGKL